MNKIICVLITGWLVLYGFWGPAAASAAAQGGEDIPGVARQLVRAPEGLKRPPAAPRLNSPSGGAQDWSSLKAVVFVGPIDGDNGSLTLSEIDSAQQTAAALRSFGVQVAEFYPNQANATWANIKAAAEGAHFLIYRGHGVYWGSGNPIQVGGFALKDRFVSNDMIRSELHPAKNFIVMLYGCFTAGSAGDDSASISLAEAQRRVAMYSAPFFDIGAGGYYADWFGDAFASYAVTLLQGGTQRQAYEGFFDYNPNQMWRGSYPQRPAMDMWLGWDLWYDPLPNYNNAFAGDPGQTLNRLFNTRLTLPATQVTYMAEAGFAPRAYNLAVSSDPPMPFNWTATPAETPAWLEWTTPLAGAAGDGLAFRVNPALAAGAQTTTVTIATNAPGFSAPAQTLTIAVLVVDKVYSLDLPVIIR